VLLTGHPVIHKNMEREQFSGPLFLVGMPRSGTKLLGTLLNRNPRIRICTLETDFLPYWIDRWAEYGDLSDRETFARFVGETANVPFFINLDYYDRRVDEESWYNACPDYTASGVFEALLRLESGATADTDIWGDKSPSYTRHVSLLLEHFPSARIVHLVRDVRDYCLSINNAWGKNMIRAAQRWTDDVSGARAAGRVRPDVYLEVRYEDLLADPGGVMERICDFLDIEFLPEMTRLKKPAEQVGDATEAKIKKDNVQKYIDRMDPGTRRTIESVAGHVLKDMGYPLDADVRRKRIGGLRMLMYQISDAFGLFRSSVKERGLLRAVWWNVRSLLTKR
jgi:hypothetical protein